jgi:hypothetical protein
MTLGDDHRRQVKSLMMSGNWRPGRSSDELAARWGCSASNVRRIASEVARSLREGIDEHEHRAVVLARLDRAYELAAAQEAPRDMVRATQALIGLLGLAGPTRHEVALSAPPPGLPWDLASDWQRSASDEAAARRVARWLLAHEVRALASWPSLERQQVCEELATILEEVSNETTAH